MLVRALSAAIGLGVFLGGAGDAQAWVEAKTTSSDVRVVVDAAGGARIEHTIGVRVFGGLFRGLDLAGVGRGLALEPEVLVRSEDAAGAPAHVESQGEDGLHVTIDDPKGLRRGSYVLALRYKVDLVATHALTRDGAMWRLGYTSPIAHEGLDSAHVVFVLPPAPTPPRADGEGLVATLRRAQDRDEVELVRPHVGRGEAAEWAVRVDPKAFPAVHDPALRPPPVAPPQAPARTPEALALAAVLALGLAYALAVRAKARAVVAGCAGVASGAAAVVPRPLIASQPVPLARGLVAGAALAGGVAAQLAGSSVAGSAAIAAAMAIASFRAPEGPRRARGPGAWLALRPSEAFATPPRAGDALDAGTSRGRVALACAAVGVAGSAAALARFDARAAFLLPLDALALAPLFLTGRGSQLPPTAASFGRVLAAIHDRLRGVSGVRVTPWARVPAGATMPDELRLLVQPRSSMPGLLGIEIAVAWVRTPGGASPVHEVLVRVHEGSAAAARIAEVAPFARALPGRRIEERVVALAPRWPSDIATVALTTRLARELTDRRAAAPEPAYGGPDRRAGSMGRAIAVAVA